MTSPSSRWLCPSRWFSSSRPPISLEDPLDDDDNVPVLSPLSPRWSLARAAALAPSPGMQPVLPSTPNGGGLLPLSFQSLQAVASSPPANNRHSILSATSTISFASTASVSSSVAQRRFWSPSPSLPSAPSSPPSAFSPTSPTSPASPSPLPRTRRSHHLPAHRTSYLPPLVDTAARTQPWQSSWKALLADLRWLAHAAPAGVQALFHGPVGPVWARPPASIAATAEAILQTVLALLAAGMLVCLPLLWACLPGIVWTACLALFFATAWLLSAPLNGGPTVAKPWDATPGHRDPRDPRDLLDTPAETWLFVSGIGESSRSLAKTLPRLAAVCGRPVTLVRPGRSYGLALDLVVALAHRWLPGWLPSPAAARLHRTLHAALADTRHEDLPARVVVLAHNGGAATVARALQRLLADVPPAWLARLEIYTFGSLAPDFVLPPDTTSPHVEHFALTQDPCARFGLLRSVRERDVRYCGSVAVLGDAAAESAHRTPTSAATLPMEDYLTALLGPEPWSMRPDVRGLAAAHSNTTNTTTTTCFLDAVVCVDRELAERREIPCPADPMTCFSSPTAAPRRFSWTGLGATAAGARRDATKHDPDGLQGLERTRRHCRAYDGRCGREVCRLATYYAEAVHWHQERFGPLPDLL